MKLVAEGGDIWLTILLTLDTDWAWYEESETIMRGGGRRSKGKKNGEDEEIYEGCSRPGFFFLF